MTRFEDFIAVKTKEVKVSKEIIAKIKKRSKPFLKSINQCIGDCALYRGMYISKNEGWKKTRKDRKPFDTPEWIHEALDKEFYKKFGWKARSQSVFAVGGAIRTTGYGGDTYIIFPTGKFEYLWSPKVSDLYGHLSQKYSTLDGTDRDWNKDVLLYIPKIVNTYKNTNLCEALKSDHEIMINCPGYFFISARLLGSPGIIDYWIKTNLLEYGVIN